MTNAAIDGDYITVETDNNLDASHVNFGSGTILNGMSLQALGGGTPTTDDYRVGKVVEDSDDPGTLWKLTPDDSWVQI